MSRRSHLAKLAKKRQKLALNQIKTIASFGYRLTFKEADEIIQKLVHRPFIPSGLAYKNAQQELSEWLFVRGIEDARSLTVPQMRMKTIEIINNECNVIKSTEATPSLVPSR